MRSPAMKAGHRPTSYECDLTDGMRRARRFMLRSPAAPTEADPASVGSPVTLRLMTIRMGGIRCAAFGDEWIRISSLGPGWQVQPIHNGHDWMIPFRDRRWRSAGLRRPLLWRGLSVTGQR